MAVLQLIFVVCLACCVPIDSKRAIVIRQQFRVHADVFGEHGKEVSP